MEYYSIYSVGEVVSYDDFVKQRLEAAAWVHFPNFVKNVLNGSYDFIYPFHIELCSTYLCNFNCPWCSCRKSRQSKSISKQTLTFPEIKRILDDCKTHNIGIQWTGGEPLSNVATIQGVIYGSNIGINQCLFTNGSLMSGQVVKDLLASNLAFIRISLNCANYELHSMFHGNIPINLSKAVLHNIKRLCEIKINTKSTVNIGISLVVDSKNVDDLLNTVRYIESLCCFYPHSINYVVIRAVNEDFEGVESVKSHGFLNKYLAAINNIDIGAFNDLGVDIVLPNEIRCNFVSIECQLGCTIFSEIAPDGSMFMCSDKYGNREFAIGNILTDNISNIWTSVKKRETQIKHKDCYNTGGCPRYSRGWYFNLIFSQIEMLRKQDKMYIVENWIKGLQKVIPKCEHSFFM